MAVCVRLTILYQDDDVVAVYKPAGLVVHRSDSTPEGEGALLQYLRDQINQHIYPVHRLDQPTSGIVLYGLSSKAAASLVDQFTNRHIIKCYQAVVVGHCPPFGTIATPLSSSETSRKDSFQNPSGSDVLRHAQTYFRTLAHFEPTWRLVGQIHCKLSLIEAMPHTGRWHQIRRHLSSIHHPILGDRRHGDDGYNNALTNADNSLLPDRMMLNASYIQFRQPTSRNLCDLRCDPDQTYQAIVDLLGKPSSRFSFDDSCHLER